MQPGRERGRLDAAPGRGVRTVVGQYGWTFRFREHDPLSATTHGGPRGLMDRLILHPARDLPAVNGTSRWLCLFHLTRPLMTRGHGPFGSSWVPAVAGFPRGVNPAQKIVIPLICSIRQLAEKF